jgi:hypothetical protein
LKALPRDKYTIFVSRIHPQAEALGVYSRQNGVSALRAFKTGQVHLVHQGGRKCRFHQLLCTTNISAWFCHQMMVRKINYFVNALLIVMAQADCNNHLLMTSFVTD